MSNTGPLDASSIEERPYGWVIVFVGTICLILGFGANISVSVLIMPLEQEFSWTRAEISFAYTMVTIGCGAGGILWGVLSDRIGARKIAFLGAFGLSIPIMTLSWQTELWAFYLHYLFIGGFGFACLFTPILALTSHWFDRRKGLALGIVTAGGAIGQGAVPYILRLMISNWDWRDAMLYLGVGYLVILIPLLFFLKPPPLFGDRQSALTSGTPLSDNNQWGVPHRISLSWVWCAGIFCCICMAVPIIHLVPLGTDLGLDPETATSVLVVLMFSGVPGRLFFGMLADRIGSLPSYAIASFGQTAVVFWFTQTQSLPMLYTFAVLFGFSYSGVMTCLIVCAREAAPLRMTGLAVALIVSAGWIGMGLGGDLAGYFYDATGNYVISYAFAAVAGAINLLVLIGLMKYRRRYAAGDVVKI